MNCLGEEDHRLLLNELVRCLAEGELFTFVLYPEVAATNNAPERELRKTAQARHTARTSKTQNGAKRRGVISSVLISLRQNLADVTLGGLVEEVSGWYRTGVSLFRQQLQELRLALPPPVGDRINAAPLPSSTCTGIRPDSHNCGRCPVSRMGNYQFEERCV